MPERITIPARCGHAVRLACGREIKVINTHGRQVVDTWAFASDDPGEFMSMEHTRSCLERLGPAVGDSLYSNQRRPILTLVEDTSPGVHDTLLSACDAERYRLLGHEGSHDNCADNLIGVLDALGIEAPTIPSPWNLFENVTVAADGRLEIVAPVAAAGDYVRLRAEMDAIVVFSACPMDIAATNAGVPKGVAIEVS